MSSESEKKQDVEQTSEPAATDSKTTKKPGPLDIIFSVLAAMIGVQSEANRERDFSKGDIGNYIFVGIIMVIIFIFGLISIVNNILEDAAK
ncbi:MAG: DUF2970 domain-containing protein [Enterobacterales bacterium]|nr:DUF2970 domain-containing protein [Enterobacterales bacterium]